MIEYRLSNISSDLTPNVLFNEVRKFGYIKNRIEIYNEECKVVFQDIKDEDNFLEFCKNKNILAKKVNENKDAAVHANIQEKQQYHKKPNNQVPRRNSISNPSFFFYKDEVYGKGIEDFMFTENCNQYFEIQDTQPFELTTSYPGLLVGSGYNHPKLHENKDDFQLGFFFDHTTGLPIISGSSIKGLLKSVCEKTDFMQDVYGKIVSLDIFEDGETIFYDAYIVETKNQNNKIFGSDYITSHYSNEENGMFKEPNPVKFLKVLPDVTFKFQFKAPKEYVELFKAIILDFGLGAKTNVGYGKFVE